ncbi:MAG: PAS domain S-box protein [Ignavibacteriales bacterium]|nr:PAS domain S-box protein [Ignavibacteriales bacterium]
MKTIWQRLRSLARPPGKWNDEQQRQAEVLHISFILIFVAGLLYAILPSSILAGQGMYYGAAMLCGMIGSLLLRFRYLHLSSVLTVSTLWIVFTAGAFTEGGITSSSFAGNVAIIIFAGLVLGLRGAITTAGVSIVAAGLLVYLSHHDLLPPPVLIYSEMNIFADFAVYLSFTALFTGIAIHRIDQSTARTKQELEQRKKAEESLSLNEKRMNDIMFSMAEWVWEVDENGVYTYTSQKRADLFGQSHEEIIGKTPFNFMPPDEAKRVAAIFSEIAATKAPIKDLENWIIGNDGERICLLTNGVPILDEEGNLKGYRGVDKDITERKKAEKALEQQNLVLVKLNALALGLASLPSSQDMHEFIAKKLKETTGAYAVAFSVYEPDNRVLRTTNLEVDPGILEKVTKILGNKIGDLKYSVNDDIYKKITTEVVGTRHTLTDVSFGTIPPIIGAAIEKLTGVDRFIGIASVIEGELYGASMLVLKTGEPEPAAEFLESCANIIAVSLRRRRAEDALRESEQNYRTLADSGLALIWTAGTDKLCNYFNNTWLNFTGRTLEQELGNGWADGVYADDLQHCFDIYVGAFDRREPFSMEYRLRRHDGEYRWILDNGNPRYDSKGLFIGYIGHCLDITERKQAERMLNEIVLKNPMSIQILDKEGFTLEVNTSFKVLFGSVPPSDYSMFHDLQLAQLGMGEIFEHLRNGEIVHFPDTYFNAHDSVPEFPDVPAWIRAIGFPLNDSDDKPEKFVLMHENITERKRAEEKLLHSELRFRSVWNNSADGMRLTDREGRILDVNDAYCKLVKIPREELLGQLFSITYQREGPTDDLSVYQKRFDRSETITNLIGRATLRTGEVVHLEVTSSFIEITGHGTMLLSLFRDITQRERSEEALRQAQKSESIGTLAGGIAHDFNNLLNAMLGQSSLALGKLSHESPARSHIEKSIKAADRAADLTRQLLAYSGKGRFLVEEIDLNLVVKENVQILEVSVPKTTQIRFELGSPPPRIQGDVGQIQQVIMNLIINAGEAVGPNPGTVTVRTGRIELAQNETKYWKYSATPLAPGSYALLQVSDNGHGMKQEVLDRIFDPFFTTKFTGRGLGLAAVLGIIRGHKGGVHITSEEGKGTRFDVVFPLVGTSLTADAREKQMAPVTDGAGKTILVIDDEASVLELLTDIFSDAKFTVIGALNPLEGIELYRRHQPDIAAVVLDYSMPGMDGKAAFEELARINKDVKVLLCSGYSEEETSAVFGDIRPAGFIQKPYQPAALLERISRLI